MYCYEKCMHDYTRFCTIFIVYYPTLVSFMTSCNNIPLVFLLLLLTCGFHVGHGNVFHSPSFLSFSFCNHSLIHLRHGCIGIASFWWGWWWKDPYSIGQSNPRTIPGMQTEIHASPGERGCR